MLLLLLCVTACQGNTVLIHFRAQYFIIYNSFYVAQVSFQFTISFLYFRNGFPSPTWLEQGFITENFEKEGDVFVERGGESFASYDNGIVEIIILNCKCHAWWEVTDRWEVLFHLDGNLAFASLQDVSEKYATHL